MSKLNNIIAGWWNLTFPSKEVEELALSRAKVCGECNENKKNICNQCGCYLPAKTRAVDTTCPLNKWKK